jgi:heme/copper-type cytochrome/quinol oxidase subunit 3
LKRRTLTDVVGIYWHFMDGLWVFLFLLLLLWR